MCVCVYIYILGNKVAHIVEVQKFSVNINPPLITNEHKSSVLQPNKDAIFLRLNRKIFVFESQNGLSNSLFSFAIFHNSWVHLIIYM